ncbi:MAG: hypothetical protein Q4B48_03775 [Syntrophomonadaceae bacterium]|nr:hypothetical protein [Syntrophomonadaceae bacterium]
MSILDDKEIPIGLGMALAQNLNALDVFSTLDETARDRVIARSRNVKSKEQIQTIIDELLNRG